MIKILLIFTITWLIICTYMMITYFVTSRRKAIIESDLLQQGVRVKGGITGETARTSLVTFLPYSYKHAGKKYTSRQIISKRDRGAFRNGRSVTILYQPENPDIAMIERTQPNERESQIAKRLAYRGLICFCCGIPIFILLLFANR